MSNVTDGVSSFKSGVRERLVVQIVDVFKPESMVGIVIVLGVDKRRICFIDDCICGIIELDRDRFKHRQGNNDDVQSNNS